MAKKELTLDLQIGNFLGMTRRATVAIDGLDASLNRLQRRLSAAFIGKGFFDFVMEGMVQVGKVSDELLVLRLALGKLGVAIGDAFTPIAQIVLPVINDAVFAAIRFTKSVGRIIRALLGVKESASDAAEAQEAVGTSALTAAGAVRRSLADFDRLNRLNQQGGSVAVGGGGYSGYGGYNYDMNLNEFLVFNTISNMLAPLKEIDIQPVTDALWRLREAVAPITKELFEGLRWAWDSIFAPMAKWGMEVLLPEVLKTLSAALQALNSTIDACKPALSYLWENFLKPLGQWAGEQLIARLGNLQIELEGISKWMSENEVSVQQMLNLAAQFLDGTVPLREALQFLKEEGFAGIDMLERFGFSLTALRTPFGNTDVLMEKMSTVLGVLRGDWGLMAEASEGAWTNVMRIWRGASQWMENNVNKPIEEGIRSSGNGIIGTLNGLCSGAAIGINSVVDGVNGIRFTIPDWIPGLGGKQLNFNLGRMETPTIPYLAKGAVLPANRPFLAVVGDQRHGTNVEAPLATIQDAVILAMDDMVTGNLAGQEQIVAVLQKILTAVLGISIGDGDIAAAGDRYRDKMALVKGGLY